MRVLVTGASGMIGSALCDALLARGDEVAGLTRDPQRARGTNPTVTWHAWDPLHERPPAAAFAGVDAVVNLVGESINQRWSDEAKQRIYASRVDATRNLMQGLASADPRPRTLISQSAVGYYGDHGEAIVDESTSSGATFDARLCVDWEAAAAEASELGMRLAIIRMAPVLSAEAGLLKELLLPFRLGVGGPLAGGAQYMPVIHINDAVGLLIWAIDTDSVSGVLNATLPDPATNREFSKALGHALHRPAIVPVPKFVIAARLGSELAQTALGSQRVVPRRTLDLGYRFRYPQVDLALEAALAGGAV